MRDFTFKEKFQYWLDKRMAKGMGSMIRILLLATLAVVIFISALIFCFRANEDGTIAGTVWDVLATTINAWMPYSEDGTFGYVILSSIAALIGVLFTSTLIGIITSGIEDRMTELKKGSTTVLEKGHTVVLGFVPGEYALIREIVAGMKPRESLIIAEDMDREEMEEYIFDNVEIPKSITLITRNIDITDQTDLAVCNLPWAKVIVVAPMDNDKTVKASLAAQAVVSEYPECDVKIVATVSSSRYMIQRYNMDSKHLIMYSTGDVIARLIAHTVTQPGLSMVFSEIFSYEGDEFYEAGYMNAIGRTFEDIVVSTDMASVIGIVRGKRVMINPKPKTVIKDDDHLLYFAENKDGIFVGESQYVETEPISLTEDIETTYITILGYSVILSTILEELPERPTVVNVVTPRAKEVEEVLIPRFKKRGELTIVTKDCDGSNIEEVEEAVIDSDFVIVLSDRSKNDDDADLEAMLLLLKLQDIRDRLQLTFNVTAEMRKEKNRKLMFVKDTTDYIIAPNMASMILAQIAANNNLRYVFRELMSNRGNEIFMKPAELFCTPGKEISVRALRKNALGLGYLIMGIMRRENGVQEMDLNPNPRSNVTLGRKDSLIVIGRN
ncbi:MAG: hypothetical protein IKE27_11770 [Oscillospiraceae bacterium]|nr:hypothetical protein [Oscillospiraceae bacterium]